MHSLMPKHISTLLLLAAAVMLHACSADDVTEVNTGHAICFRPAASRAQEITTAGLDHFYVSAYYADNTPFFEQVKFTRSATTGFFTSTQSYYWPEEGTLTFYCWATPDDSDITSVAFSEKNKTLTFDSGTVTDLITTEATGSKAANEVSGVPLTFAHRTAMVTIKARCASEIYTIRVKEAGVRGFVNVGTFGLVSSGGTSGPATNKWSYRTGNVSNRIFTSEFEGDQVTLTPEVATIASGTLIPQSYTTWDGTHPSGANISLLVNISTADGYQVFPPAESGSEWAYSCVEFPMVGRGTSATRELTAGQRYIITLDYSAGAGKKEDQTNIFRGHVNFNVEVEEWGEQQVDQEITE